MEGVTTRGSDARFDPRRLGIATGTLVVVALALLPFAGRPTPNPDEVATVAGDAPALAHPSSTTTTTSPPPAAAPSVVPAASPSPPTDAVAPPPPPPAPAGADLGAGAITGDGAVVVPTAAAPMAVEAPALEPDGERVWAVIVGIDDYPGTSHDLRSATADAADLATALAGFGVPRDHVITLFDHQAGTAELLGAVDWLVANAGPEDTAVFLFAGHVRDLGYGTEAMVTADSGWITDWFLAEAFEDLRARDAWFVVAGCYGGGFDELLGPGRVLTAAAAPGQLAFESDAYGRSYFAEFVLRRALVEGAAGFPTVQAAVGWGAAQLAEHHPDRQLWHHDAAGHTIWLDGSRGDVDAPPVPQSPRPDPPDDLVTALLGGGSAGNGDDQSCTGLATLLGSCR